MDSNIEAPELIHEPGCRVLQDGQGHDCLHANSTLRWSQVTVLELCAHPKSACSAKNISLYFSMPSASMMACKLFKPLWCHELKIQGHD